MARWGRFSLRGTEALDDYCKTTFAVISTPPSARYIIDASVSKLHEHSTFLSFPFKLTLFIYQMNCKMNIKYSQDIDKVINNDFYCKY